MLHRGILITLGALLAWVVLNASVCEDGYITFRVVDNVVHGFGLRWNTDERVQVYTNPLWMLLHIPFYALWENIFYLTIGISAACTLAAIVLTLESVKRSPLQQLVLVLLPFAVSRSVFLHSATGLENPLSHLLFAYFGWVIIRVPKAFWLHIGLAVSLSMVNRLDTVILYIPPLLWLWFTQRSSIRYRSILLGLSPIVLWEAFSLFYYGSLFPNTLYAKQDPILPRAEYIRHGIWYLGNLFAMDLAGGLWMATGAILIPVHALLRRKADRKLACIGIGIGCYALYVIYVGGNHVTGRFWSLPVFASIWLAYVYFIVEKKWLMALGALLIILKVTYPSKPVLRRVCHWCFNGIALNGNEITLWSHIQNQLTLPTPDRRPDRMRFFYCQIDGVPPFKGGPYKHMIDTMALPDALLARLPCNCNREGFFWRVGHLTRDMPAGYFQALKYGRFDKMDEDLRAYYKPLRFITRGPLWDTERLRQIVLFNLGVYDPFLHSYIQRVALKPLEDKSDENEPDLQAYP